MMIKKEKMQFKRQIPARQKIIDRRYSETSRRIKNGEKFSHRFHLLFNLYGFHFFLAFSLFEPNFRMPLSYFASMCSTSTISEGMVNERVND